MEKLINYIIIPELRIIVESYKRRLTSMDAINYKKTMLQDPAYDPAFNMITDLRELDLDIRADEDIKQLSVYLDFLKNTAVERKVALLTDKPYQAVLAQLFKEMARETLIKYEVFSTVSASINYTGIAMSNYMLINQTLESLRCIAAKI